MSIEQETHALLDLFEKAAVGLFEVTGRYIKHFEQGTYGCAIAKPSKRMTAALSIDREVLVVSTTFRDQQQRTLKFVVQEIQESVGRFESTLAVVLHKDREGNSKLRNWGRDLGISVLPLLDGDSFNSAEALERALCVELFSHDPFDVTGPVSDDANFFGRRDEAINLARKLQRGQIRSCLGIRKIGKTSILNRVLHEIRTEHDCTCVMVDCSRDDIWRLDAAALLASIALTVERARNENLKYSKLEIKAERVSLEQAREGLEEGIKMVSRPFILVFDEVDYITPGSPTNNRWAQEFNIFWRNLRAVYQEVARIGSGFSVLVAGVSGHWFSVESIEGVENAVLAFIPEEYLSPMPLGASVAMLKRLARIAGLQIEDDAAHDIAVATGNMPFWSRKCASYINRMIPVLDRPCVVGRERIAPLLAEFVREEGSAIAEVALRHLFRVYPSLYPAAAACFAGAGASVSEAQLRVLRRYGVVGESSTILAGEMMLAGFDALSRSREGAQTVQEVGSSAGADKLSVGMDEWAEEVAAIGKRRNLLERRLRELVLNFVRFDALSSGQVPNLLARIVAVLPAQQRDSLAHLSAESAIGKFLWTDLVKLIDREWTLFERIFGNKTDFLHHCSLVNDRVDAHAKPADLADFAMYRRSLSYLEERIAKLQ